jgi:hypothetical protein
MVGEQYDVTLDSLNPSNPQISPNYSFKPPALNSDTTYHMSVTNILLIKKEVSMFVAYIEKKAKMIESFIRATNARLHCFKILKFTLNYTINAPTCFGLTKTSSGSLQSVHR